MNAKQWRLIEEFYYAAMEQPVEERLTFVHKITSTEPEIRSELESLVTGSGPPDDFLEEPPLHSVAVAPLPDLAPGTTLLHYRVLKKLGEGGMGVVYHARDTLLDRDVAIKLLSDEFTNDPDRLARFRTEARLLAALNHPNILVIHQLEIFQNRPLLVLELVGGETLAGRLVRGSISVRESLVIAREIADGLHAAHDQGVIHLDLKPSNIMISREGRVKIMDFGLAQGSWRPDDKSVDSSLPSAGSENERIFGSPSYLSPEQVDSSEVNSRSDIWMFGCVLFEMLTGRRAFAEETLAETLTVIRSAEPDWSVLPNDLPLSVRLLLQRCLRKDPARRLQCLGDARIEIEEALAAPSTHVLPLPTQPISSRFHQWAWLLLAVALLTTGVAIATRLQRNQDEPAEVHFQLETPPTDKGVMLALSPDGRRIVFVISSGTQSQLYIRSMDSVVSQPLPGTEGASYPFWSPNGRFVAFFARGQLKRLDLDSQRVISLADAQSGRGGTWNSEGAILFMPSANGVLQRISENGEASEPLTHLLGSRQRLPQFLPDGRHFVYRATTVKEGDGLYVASLDDTNSKRLLSSDSGAVVASSGHLLFIRGGTLFSQFLDTKSLSMSGVAVPTAFQASLDQAYGIGGFSVARNILAYRPGPPSIRQQLVWFDRKGNVIGNVSNFEPHTPRNPEVSPDGERVAIQGEVNRNVDVWLISGSSVSTQSPVRRFTFEPSGDVMPIWSHDGSRVIFGSNRNGVRDLYQKPADGAGPEELVLRSGVDKTPTDVSRDGRFLLYRTDDPKSGFDLWALPLFGDRKPFAVVKTEFIERNGQFSPDGRLIAYESNESGRFEVYIQTFPEPRAKWQVSVSGGAQPRWRRDGKELFYIGLDSQLMAVPIGPVSTSQAPAIGTPAALFEAKVAWGPLPGVQKQQYTVSPDGTRFLLNMLVKEETSPIMVIVNWRPPKKTQN